MCDTISFTVNGKLYNVKNPDVQTTFNQWLRQQPGLTGTKVMCNEGGCGCCCISLARNDETLSVNSCLLPLCSVDGCNVTTIEGIGSLKNGHHVIQKRIAKFHASQCGYCTPGFVVNMHSMLESNKCMTQQKIENSFDGNLCRCTGYRPILDAMKSFASDAEPRIVQNCEDIEDLRNCKNQNKKCDKACIRNVKETSELNITNENAKWIKPLTIQSLITAVKEANGKSYILCGNTGAGVFRDPESKQFTTFINVSSVAELNEVKCEEFLEVGACVSLQRLHELLISKSQQSITFLPMAEHIAKVASVPVRNVASWAGNLVLKHKHRTFQSDVFTVFVGAAARLKIFDVYSDTETECDLFGGEDSFLSMDLDGKIILSIKFPMFKDNESSLHKMKSYKVMPRSQNAHAYVNAAFQATLTKEKNPYFQNQPILAYGGISSNFMRAYATEKYLVKKHLNDKTFHGALKVLKTEIIPEQFDVSDVSCGYKKDVAISLFYKFFISLCDPSNISPRVISAAVPSERKVSTATHSFGVDPAIHPVSHPLPHLSSIHQSAGEAYYSSDRLATKDELFALFVPASVANADIDHIDVSEALIIPGCVEIISKDNFPSDVKNTHLYPADPTQPIIATDHVEFAGQPVAMVIAESPEIARQVAKAVKVTFKNHKQPILTIEDAIKQESYWPCYLEPFEIGDVDKAIKKSDHKIEGEMHMGSQYHMYMETQFARVSPTEEGGFEVESSTQCQTWIQNALSYAFGVSCNKISLQTKRVGGSYGGKATNSLLTAAGAALAAHVTNRPVRMHPDMQECMETYGMRSGFYIKYIVGVNNDGILQGVHWHAYADCGCSASDGEVDDESVIKGYMDNAYFCENWKFSPVACKTNFPSRTWMRCPGIMNMIGMAEQMMEHVAFSLNKDPIDIKMANLYRKGQCGLFKEPFNYCSIREIYDRLLNSADVRNRNSEIAKFNANNKWKKRGLAVTPLKYSVSQAWVKYNTMVVIYAEDGTVVITNGGIECGQGINVKAAQVAAHVLGIPLDMISVQQTSTLTSPNSAPTGGSVASEVNCMSIKKCCEILNSRISPIREKMKKGASWSLVIKRCDSSGVDLCAEAMVQPDHKEQHVYRTYGVTASEVELDVLTGQHQIKRVDIIYDCGVSLNPAVDIGQAEGGFVMGLGYWLSEKLVYDRKTGKLLTNRTWNYKIPSSKDIPEVWNIEFLKDAPNPTGFMRSKTAGEPPLCMAVGVFHALKHAIDAARADRNQTNYIAIDAPATVEDVQRMIAINVEKDLIL